MTLLIVMMEMDEFKTMNVVIVFYKLHGSKVLIDFD